MLESPSGLQLYLKETPTLLFSCEIYEISKNIYFEEQLKNFYLFHPKIL